MEKLVSLKGAIPTDPGLGPRSSSSSSSPSLQEDRGLTFGHHQEPVRVAISEVMFLLYRTQWRLLGQTFPPEKDCRLSDLIKVPFC